MNGCRRAAENRCFPSEMMYTSCPCSRTWLTTEPSNANREIEPGEHDSGFTGFMTKVSQQGFQFTDLGWFRRGVTSVRTERSLRTPPLRRRAAPVGVVDNRGLIHDRVVILDEAGEPFYYGVPSSPEEEPCEEYLKG
jgi:hypothetical protein